MKRHIKNILLGFLLLSGFGLFAGEIQPITGILRTTSLTIAGVDSTVQIQAFSMAGTADYSIKNIISLNYDQNTDTFLLNATNIRVKVSVYRWAADSSVISPTRTENLIVSVDNRYNKQTIDKSSLKLENGYRVKVKIDSIFINGVSVAVLPRFVYIESEIHMNRYYDFSSVATDSIDIMHIDELDTDCDDSSFVDELRFNWENVIGAEEYQVEWTYVNNYGVDSTTFIARNDLVADFKNNSTRITTTGNSYRVSLVYEKGYVAFRVRPVGRDYLHPEKNIYGVWSAPDLTNLDAVDDSCVYHNIRAHEGKKNWQYNSTFAEEGKKKEVISYFDGSLHNRQSVTKVNSDKNVIVGETLYDFQGRPAVNVLPTPVVFPGCELSYTEPALKYYPDYNRNMHDTVYSKLDFDKDSHTGTCNPYAPGMDTTSGSSRYYSSNNPDKTFQQAFVPDAQLFPFSQVEYTPDNTGRVRNQSGVGEKFQLGSGHETKYLYGQPNQIQLDRLFGSEAGDASHYKKNVVFDANGQASISYLNQEGKTIATALAGNAPIDSSSNTILSPLASEASALDTLTVDLFNKDASGNSLLNKITPLQDGIEFSTQLTVAYTSTYKFSYDLTVDTLYDPCLKENICMSCIYDLEIKVVNECGMDLTSLGTYDSLPINKMVGHLDSIPNGFTMTCSETSGSSVADSISLELSPGVYTVSKVLTLNKAARDFYVKSYLDTTYNSCVKTLDDFIAEAMAGIDTTACYPTCATCIAELGTKDDFVAQGRGTDVQYDYLYEQCAAPCKDRTLCDNSYEMMLLDVSPGGQYGEFDASTVDASGYALSVFNTNNTFNSNLWSGDPYNWKHPHLKLNGTEYNMYIDDNGERTRIHVAYDGVSYTPSVDDNTKVYTDTTTAQLYTYPENLTNLSDFIPAWNDYFARSLVEYHPEYVYYIACSDHAKVYSGDSLSTDQFDSLLMVSETFQDAFNNHFIKSNYDSVAVNPNAKINDWFTQNSLSPYDAFFSNSSYGLTFPVPGGSTSLSAAYLTSQMQYKFSHYALINGQYYTMVEVAGMIARCGSNFMATPTAQCLEFGSDFFASTEVHKNDSIRNKEWSLLKNFYISEKRKLQFYRMDFYAKYYNWLDPNWHGGCNACIGNNDFNIFSSGMFVPYIIGYPHTPSYNHRQPCSLYSFSQYTNRQKRFIDPANSGLSTSNVPYQIFQETGQCPMTFLLENFLNGMAQDSILASPSPVSLNTVSEFAPDLYSALHGGSSPSLFINYQWTVISETADLLTVKIVEPLTLDTVCGVTLQIDSTVIPDFASIHAIHNLTYDHMSSGLFYFNAAVTYSPTDSSTAEANITGSSCINIKDCSFEPICTPNQFAVDLVNLSNAMLFQGLAGSSNYNISTDTIISPFISSVIKNTLGTPNSTIKWNFVAPKTIQLYDSLAPSKKIVMTNSSFTPPSLIGDVVGYIHVKSLYNNLFSAEGVDSNGVTIGILKGKVEMLTGTDTIGISMGNCSFPEPAECQSKEHQVRKDLQNLFDDFLTDKPFTGNVDLFAQANFTSLLHDFYPPGIDSTSSTYTYDTTYSTNYDTLIFNINDGCKLELYHSLADTTAHAVNFSNLISVTNLTGSGTTDENGNYYSFYCVGTYNRHDTIVSDTIRGISCWPLKNCDHCNDTAMVTPIAIDSSTIGIPVIFAGMSDTINYYVNIDTAECQNRYDSLLVALHNYNLSLYASEHLDTLNEDIYPSSYLFVQSGYCNCVESYIWMLDTLIAAHTGSLLSLPGDIDHYSGCDHTRHIFDAHAGCRKLYDQYSAAVTAYNTFVGINPGYHYPAIDTTYQLKYFLSHYCNCGDKFLANLSYIETAPSLDSSAVAQLIDINQSCQTAPCVPHGPDTAVIFPTIPYSVNPCVQQMINIAVANAGNEYNDYKDSITTSIASRYAQHCLDALENFKYNYQDKEYHFTLYYYDQAGNLVKTIPPEGIEKLNISSFTDPLEIQISGDRANSTHTVFTSHRMPTSYEYNSLNQLVTQDMPDHDKMSLLDFTLPNGLDSRLKIIRTQFVSGAKGYLTGYLDLGGGAARGYVYTTDDAGNNWTRVNNTVGADIKDIMFVNDTLGFAVGTKGVVLKTKDGGNSWDATNIYSLSGDDLNAVCFRNASKGAVAGNKRGSASGIYYTSDGGITFSNSSGLASNDTVTSITYDGSNYYATVKNNGEGKLYKATEADTWIQQSLIRANNLVKVQYVDVTSGILAYAVGEDGTLLKSTVSSNTSWELVPAGTSRNFRDVYFKDANDGVAVIDSSANKGQIYKTFDGGKTWELLSTPGSYYYSLQQYDAGGDKLLASGENGLLSKVLLSSEPFGMITVSKPSYVNDLKYADAVIYSGSPQAVAVGNNDTIYYTENANASGVTWKKIKSSSFGVSGGDADFKKVLIKDTVGNTLKGVVLTQNGKLYSFYKNSSDFFSFTIDSVVDLSNSPIGSYFFNDITMDSHSSTKFYAFDTISKRAFTGTMTTDASPHAKFKYMDTVTAQHKYIQSIAVDNGGNNLLLAGSRGAVKYKSNPNSTTTNYGNRTYTIAPVPLNSVSAKAAGEIYAAGDDGSEWNTVNGGTNWHLLNTGTSEKMNSVKIDFSGTTGVIACNNGKFFKQSVTDSLTIALTEIDLGTTDNLTTVQLKDSTAYVGTSTGEIIHVADIGASDYANVNVLDMNGGFNGMAFKPSSFTLYTVGDNASVYQCLADNSAKNNDVFLPLIAGVSFANANNGYLATQGDIRHTVDAGQTWTPIVPDQVTTFNNIYCTKPDQAILLGINKYFGTINGNTTPDTVMVSGGSSSTKFYNIDFNQSGYGVISSSLRNVYSVTASGSTFTVSYIGQAPAGSPTNYSFMAVKVFPDNSFLVAGGECKIYYYDGSFHSQTSYPTITSASTKSFLDIYFHDDRTGYISGTNGIMLKCSLTGNIMDSGYGDVAGSIIWDTLSMIDPFNVYTGGNKNDIDLYTVDFTDRIHGFVGGIHNSVTNAKYATLLNDQTGYYSTRFWYDRLGRMVVSQNTKQYNKTPKAYSYTLYDELGRIEEVGEKAENTTTTKFKHIFGDYVNGFFNNNTISDDSLTAWITGAGQRREVTRTYYDTVLFTGMPMVQENLRKRVSDVTYEDVYDGVDTTYQHATHYTYDIHGNVNTLVQDNPEISVSGQRYKRIDYDYDLISGKVNKVIYQPNAPDLFIHRYTYDADNRITKVETSTDDIIYDLDAKYFYYAHGPLARVEYGKNQVQGQDYAYTLQGWIKGVNSNTLNAGRDMGKDGYADTNNLNANFGRDAYGYTLNYYNGDYKAIDRLKWNSVNDRFEAYAGDTSNLKIARYDLFNGNITSMATTLVQTDTAVTGVADAQIPKPLGNAYKYDQLNRLKGSYGFASLDLSNNSWMAIGNGNMYKNLFVYDANGNITAQARFDTTNLFDLLQYQYQKDASGHVLRNRLYHVNDSRSAGIEPDDIDDQGAFDSTAATMNIANNYGYDEIGNLMRDSTEEIDSIKWTVYGKIKEIKRVSGSSKKNLKFDYDASGNRIAKHVLSSAGDWEKSTYYIKDARGNVVSVYDQTAVDDAMSFKLNEQDLYGSVRLGTRKPALEMIGADTTEEIINDTLEKKQYEFSNHLQNSLTLVSDRKIALDSNSDHLTDFWQSSVLSNNDYSAFGCYLKGRNYVNYGSGSYGFNGQEKDDEISGNGNSYTAEFWEYDPRLGKRWNIDPVIDAWESPYAAFANNPIFYTDILGNTEDERKKAIEKAKDYEQGSSKTSASYGGKGEPGKPVDCSGLVANCIVSAGLENPNSGDKNGVTNIVNHTTKEGINEIRAGDFVTFNGDHHIALIVGNIQKDAAGNVISFDIIGSQTSTGPNTITIYADKSGTQGDGNSKYWSKLLGDAYKWDTNEDGTQNGTKQSTANAVAAATTTTDTKPVLTKPTAQTSAAVLKLKQEAAMYQKVSAKYQAALELYKKASESDDDCMSEALQSKADKKMSQAETIKKKLRR